MVRPLKSICTVVTHVDLGSNWLPSRFFVGKGSELVELPDVDIGFKNLDYD